MNTRAQFDLHPDAESLNAFAEQALGEREHEEIVAHLAVCGRCRQVVFLAQEATGLEVAEDREDGLVTAAMPVLADRIAAPRRSWYRSWWMMWAPVGALAVMLALLTVMHVRHVERDSEMAKDVPAMTPQAERSELPASSVPATNAGTKGPAAKQKLDEATQGQRAEAKGGDESRTLGIAAPPPPAAPPEVNRPMARGSGGGLQAAEGLMASSRAEGRAAAKKETPELDLKNEQERPAMAAPVHPPETAAAQVPLPSATASVRVSDQLMAASAQAVPESESSLKARHVGRVAGTFSMYKAMPPLLPSGLPAVSTATTERSVLGIDKTGNVFLSNDAGVRWEVVPRQWNGRAVAVRVQEISKKDEAAGSGTPAAKFELVNDEGKVWVSGDGRTWKVR